MKSTLLFPPDLIVDTDVSKEGLIAVHKPLDPTVKGYVLTHLEDLSVLAWAPLKSTAVAWRKQIEKALVAGENDEHLHWLIHFMRVNG